MALQSLVRAASLGQLSRVSALSVPGAKEAVRDAVPAAAAPVTVQPVVSTSVRSYHAGNMEVPLQLLPPQWSQESISKEH